ncbi:MULTISPECIES: helix-turn-helix domain-containing protein [unclassified Wolbachia]|nr:helix-turn-helix transcriptional regulator [Wolbachia endosymbiont (group A) of Apoderus coryli]
MIEQSYRITQIKNFLKNIVDGRGYTQEELAKKLNIGPSQIHHYEQDDFK